jgi:regulator of chromosome condensation
LGDSDILEAKNPKKVPILNFEPSSKVYQICCGGMHTLVLTTLGKIFSWGCNDDGALGRSGIDNQPVMIDTIPYPMNNISAGDSFSIAYNTELNLVYQWGAFRVKKFFILKIDTFVLF